jgi:hypothetical protein
MSGGRLLLNVFSTKSVAFRGGCWLYSLDYLEEVFSKTGDLNAASLALALSISEVGS